jgi:hypothetical protein
VNKMCPEHFWCKRSKAGEFGNCLPILTRR